MNSFSYPYRATERDGLQRQLWLAQNDNSRISVVYGRHFMGKSALVSEALKGPDPVVFLSLGGKNETLALEEYKRHCARQLGVFVPRSIGSLEELFNFLCDEAWKKTFSVVMDNFQEAPKRYPDFCQHLARKWRSEAKRTKMNLVLICGDEPAANELILADDAPLKGLCATFRIEPLSIEFMRGLLPATTEPADVLAFWLFTGGRPDAVRIALQNDAVTKTQLLELFMQPDSPLANLCEKSLYSLLGKNSDTYLSILQLVACGVKSQAELEQRLGGMIIGGHLAKLENEYQMLRKARPLLSSPDSRGVVRYSLADPSLALWFRLLYADGGVGTQAAEVLDSYLKEDLRDFLIEKFTQEGVFTSVGSDWAASARISKKKPGKNEPAEKEPDGVDIVALKGKKAMIAAVCPNAGDFKKEPFFKQVDALKNGPLKGYSLDPRLFTLQDV